MAARSRFEVESTLTDRYQTTVPETVRRALKLGKDGLNDDAGAALPEIAARISAAERRAMAAERETTERLIASFLRP